MKEITLRPYQQECLDIINNLESGSYLVVLSVGLGKTVIFTHLKPRGRMLILSHREELVHQPLQYFDCKCGVEQAGESSHGEDIVSASVQSLVHRLHRFNPDDFDIIITDEAHHSVAPTYRKIYDYFKPRLHLGFTATANRRDKIGLGQIFERIIFDHDLKWGIENKYLCDIECRRIDVGYDLRKVKQRQGDFAPDELEKEVNRAVCNEAIGEVYKEYAVGKTLVFASSVAHAHNIAEYIPGAEVITGTTKNRSAIIDRFQNGDLNCIVNCLVLTEGVDLPCVETIIMARPTRNVSLYTQVVGRGTRTFEGKEKLHLIDCVGVSKLKICTAPVLFGIDPDVAARTRQNKGLLSDMEDRIEKAQQKLFFGKDFWKINSELVDIFVADGGYNLHGVNYTVLGNGGLRCSLGKNKSLTIDAEDAVGKTSLRFYNGRHTDEKYENIQMQDALDKAHEILTFKHANSVGIWDLACVNEWGKDSATMKQVRFVKGIYTNEELEELGVDLETLNKYQASVLIDRKMGEKRSA